MRRQKVDPSFSDPLGPGTAAAAASSAGLDAAPAFTGHVQVAVRVRPLSEGEAARGELMCVAVFPSDDTNAYQRVQTTQAVSAWAASKRARAVVGGDGMTLRMVREAKESGTLCSQTQPGGRGGAAASATSSWWAQHLSANTTSSSCTTSSAFTKDFRFPVLLGPYVSQQQAYDMLQVKRLCYAAFEGKAAAVMCFGQTGSGKTFTISGRSAPLCGEDEDDAGVEDPLPEGMVQAGEDGLQYKAIATIIRCREKVRRAGQHVRVQASYVELYNERVKDLLQGRDNLKLRYHLDSKSFYLEGLMIVECETEEDLLAVLREGQLNRQRAAHLLNADSSRSHTIFTVYVEVGGAPVKAGPQRDAVELGFDEDESGAVAAASRIAYGKLSFVDLAGAERLKETQSSGEDTKSINKSLFALGNVIERLSQQQQQQQAPIGNSNSRRTPGARGGHQQSFVPYRSSALTQLLMDSLSGNCELLFIACVTPLQRFYEESIKTLYYAQRTTDMNCRARTRMDKADLKAYAMEERLQQLQEENRIFRQFLKLPARGALGEEDIRRQIHALLQQRGSGAAAAGGGGGGEGTMLPQVTGGDYRSGSSSGYLVPPRPASHSHVPSRLPVRAEGRGEGRAAGGGAAARPSRLAALQPPPPRRSSTGGGSGSRRRPAARSRTTPPPPTRGGKIITAPSTGATSLTAVARGSRPRDEVATGERPQPQQRRQQQTLTAAPAPSPAAESCASLPDRRRRERHGDDGATGAAATAAGAEPRGRSGTAAQASSPPPPPQRQQQGASSTYQATNTGASTRATTGATGMVVKPNSVVEQGEELDEILMDDDAYSDGDDMEQQLPVPNKGKGEGAAAGTITLAPRTNHEGDERFTSAGSSPLVNALSLLDLLPDTVEILKKS